MATYVQQRAKEFQQPAHLHMPRDFQVRTTAVLLAIVTVAAVCLSYVNLQAERRYSLPYDGVWWLEKDGKLQAEKVLAGGPGDRAGIRAHDVPIQVNEQDTRSAASLNGALVRAGVYPIVEHRLLRARVPPDLQLVTIPADRP